MITSLVVSYKIMNLQFQEMGNNQALYLKSTAEEPTTKGLHVNLLDTRGNPFLVNLQINSHHIIIAVQARLLLMI